MFETFSVPQFYLQTAAAFVPYGYGRLDALVLDSGHSTIATHARAVYQGRTIANASKWEPIAGAHLDEQLRKGCYNHIGAVPKHHAFLSGRHPRLGSASPVRLLGPDCARKVLEHVTEPYALSHQVMDSHEGCPDWLQHVKAHMCDVASTSEQGAVQHNTVADRIVLQPDGSVVELSDAVLNCPELLIPPAVSCLKYAMEEPYHGPSNMLGHLLDNVLLAGGSSLFPNMQARVQETMMSLTDHSRVKVHASDNRSIWLGSVLPSWQICPLSIHVP